MAVLIKYQPLPLELDDEDKVDTSKLEVVISGSNYKEALNNLVDAINEDVIDTENNLLLIEETNG